ncbi:MAG: sensor histidine kinase [Pyrinomonadaceae bacterium MAG19_C2-C3]|nr:sensor histidine kinase [Pyrinomonadaceae bacterium MAG19_C2-C3]
MLKRLSNFINAAVVFIGCVVLAGWAFNVERLRSVVPGLPEMVPNTALAFVLAGIALRLHGAGGAKLGYAKLAGRACALVVVALGFLTIGEYLLNADLYVDRLLAWIVTKDGEAVLTGRMSPHTSFNFIIIGCALLSADIETRGGVHAAQVLALTSASVSLVALVGYVYGVTALYGISPQTGMALHTATTFLLISAGIMLIHPDRGLMRLITGNGLGGVVARRLLAATIVVPLLFGWLSVLGQRLNLYDASVASSLLVVGTILAFSGLVWSGATTLDRLDLKRREAEDARTRLLQRVVTAQEEERHRLARELHDQMGQHLAALTLQLELHKSEVEVHKNQNRQNIDATITAKDEHLMQALMLTEQLTREARTMAWELRPPELDHFGLQAALARYVEQWSKRSGVTVDFVSDDIDEKRLSPQIEIVVYRVVQEALTNVLKHARASSVSLILERRTHELLVIVEDDGRGFDAEAFANSSSSANQSLGLLGMRERVESVHGTLNIESGANGNTTLVVRIPTSDELEENVS